MNNKSSFNYDKLSKYRQQIKQNVISQQNNPPRQQTRNYGISNSSISLIPSTLTKIDNSRIMGNSLSRQNLRKNPYQQPRTDRNNRESYDNKYDNKPQNKLENKYEQQQQRTIHKSSSSRSPIKINNIPIKREQSQLTKRKVSAKQSTLNQYSGKDTTYRHNLSRFQTFSPNNLPNFYGSPPPQLYSGLIDAPQGLAQGQVKILLQENQLLTQHLNQNVQRVKSLQNQLKNVVKSQILHEQRYDISLSQVKGQKNMIKKSTDQQINTLVRQIKKLSDQLVQKQDDWQSRLNLVRKHHLQQTQEIKKYSLIQQQRYKNEIDSLKVQLQNMRFQFSNLREENDEVIRKLKTQILDLQSSVDRLQHVHKLQISQIIISHQNKVKQIGEQQGRKVQILNLEKINRQAELNNQLKIMQRERHNLISEIEKLKHELEFKNVKEMQQKGKLLIELRQAKQTTERSNKDEKSKLESISKCQLQTTVITYEQQLSQLHSTIISLQQLLSSRQTQIERLYAQIASMRQSYNSQIQAKQKHMEYLDERMNKLIQQNAEQVQYLKIKLANLMNGDIQTIQQLYEHKLQQQQNLVQDKEITIQQLRQRIQHTIQQKDVSLRQYFNEIKQLKLTIQLMESQRLQTIFKQKTQSQLNQTGNDTINQNFILQKANYQKSQQIKDQNIKRLTLMIYQKDTQISSLQTKLQMLRASNKQELQQLADSNQLLMQSKDDLIRGLKQQVQYHRKQVSKKMQQFNKDKQYYSNQLKQTKVKQQSQWQQYIDQITTELNSLKTQNKQLRVKYDQVSKEYTEYVAIWNEEKIMNRLKQSQQEFKTHIRQEFSSKQQLMIKHFQQQIAQNHIPHIASMNLLIQEKQLQLNDMKVNYHQLEKKFQLLMEQIDERNIMNSQILKLGKNDSLVVGNFVRLNDKENNS